jgi:hypothetical protein
VSSKGGTRTRDPRLMKPVPRSDSRDATMLPSKKLQDEHESCNFGAQHKAQHFGPPDDVDARLSRLVDLWHSLSADDRATLAAQVELLAERNMSVLD